MNIVSPSELIYFVEAERWAVFWDGFYITQNLTNLIKASLRVTTKGLRDGKARIIHYGSINTYKPPTNFKKTKEIVTYYHVVPQDTRTIQSLKEHIDEIDLIHTSCNITKEALVQKDIDGSKIKVIPLGVDHKVFNEYPEKSLLRKKYGLPLDKFIIGSFQKDGVGWSEGNEPKLIKGPDVLIDVIRQLAINNEIFILLTGPARGYVTNKFEEYGIPYRHFYIKDYFKINTFYNMIDAYLITSRVEGGPKSLLEAMANKVPVVSTKVGMSYDLINDGKNGFITEVEDVTSLVKSIETLIKEKDLRDKVRINGYLTSLNYNWEKVAKIYYDELYALFSNINSKINRK